MTHALHCCPLCDKPLDREVNQDEFRLEPYRVRTNLPVPRKIRAKACSHCGVIRVYSVDGRYLGDYGVLYSPTCADWFSQGSFSITDARALYERYGYHRFYPTMGRFLREVEYQRRAYERRRPKGPKDPNSDQNTLF